MLEKFGSPKLLPMTKEEDKMGQESLSPYKKSTWDGGLCCCHDLKLHSAKPSLFEDEEKDKELRHIY